MARQVERERESEVGGRAGAMERAVAVRGTPQNDRIRGVDVERIDPDRRRRQNPADVRRRQRRHRCRRVSPTCASTPQLCSYTVRICAVLSYCKYAPLQLTAINAARTSKRIFVYVFHHRKSVLKLTGYTSMRRSGRRRPWFSSGVTMRWLLRLVTGGGGPLVVGAPDSSRVLSD